MTEKDGNQNVPPRLDTVAVVLPATVPASGWWSVLNIFASPAAAPTPASTTPAAHNDAILVVTEAKSETADVDAAGVDKGTVVASAVKTDPVIATLPTDTALLDSTTNAPTNSTLSGSTIDASFVSADVSDHEQIRSQLSDSVSLASIDGTSEWTEVSAVSARLSDCDTEMVAHASPSPPHMPEDIRVSERCEVPARISSPLSSPLTSQESVALEGLASTDAVPATTSSLQDVPEPNSEFVRGEFVSEEETKEPFGAPPFQVEALASPDGEPLAALLQQLQPVAEVATLLATVPAAISDAMDVINKPAIYKQAASIVSLTLSSVILFSTGLQLIACQHAAGVLWPSLIVAGGLVGGINIAAPEIAILFAREGKPNASNKMYWIFSAATPAAIGVGCGGMTGAAIALLFSLLYAGTFLAGVGCVILSGYVLRSEMMHLKQDAQKARQALDTAEECIAYLRQALGAKQA